MARRPWYASEECFRRYETVITAAIKEWPQIVKFKTGRAVSTDAARCRDAISSLRLEKWPSDFNFDPHYPKVAKLSTMTEYYVYVGPRAELVKLRKRMEHASMFGSGNDWDHEITEVTMKEVELFQALDRPRREVKVTLPHLGEEHVEDEDEEPADVSYDGLELSAIIELIDSGKTTRPHFLDISDDNITCVTQLIGDRLNVAWVIDKRQNQIRIF